MELCYLSGFRNKSCDSGAHESFTAEIGWRADSLQQFNCPTVLDRAIRREMTFVTLSA